MSKADGEAKEEDVYLSGKNIIAAIDEVLFVEEQIKVLKGFREKERIHSIF